MKAWVNWSAGMTRMKREISFLHNKSRELKDKTMTASEAVASFVKNGDFIASGGFGHIPVFP